MPFCATEVDPFPEEGSGSGQPEAVHITRKGTEVKQALRRCGNRLGHYQSRGKAGVAGDGAGQCPGHEVIAIKREPPWLRSSG